MYYYVSVLSKLHFQCDIWNMRNIFNDALSLLLG